MFKDCYYPLVTSVGVATIKRGGKNYISEFLPGECSVFPTEVYAINVAYTGRLLSKFILYLDSRVPIKALDSRTIKLRCIMDCFLSAEYQDTVTHRTNVPGLAPEYSYSIR